MALATSLLVNANADLKFIVWDCEVKDSDVAGAAALKPELVGGKGLQVKDQDYIGGHQIQTIASHLCEMILPVVTSNKFSCVQVEKVTSARHSL